MYLTSMVSATRRNKIVHDHQLWQSQSEQTEQL